MRSIHASETCTALYDRRRRTLGSRAELRQGKVAGVALDGGGVETVLVCASPTKDADGLHGRAEAAHRRSSVGGGRTKLLVWCAQVAERDQADAAWRRRREDKILPCLSCRCSQTGYAASGFATMTMLIFTQQTGHQRLRKKWLKTAAWRKAGGKRAHPGFMSGVAHTPGDDTVRLSSCSRSACGKDHVAQLEFGLIRTRTRRHSFKHLILITQSPELLLHRPSARSITSEAMAKLLNCTAESVSRGCHSWHDSCVQMLLLLLSSAARSTR